MSRWMGVLDCADRRRRFRTVMFRDKNIPQHAVVLRSWDGQAESG